MRLAQFVPCFLLGLALGCGGDSDSDSTDSGTMGSTTMGSTTSTTSTSGTTSGTSVTTSSSSSSTTGGASHLPADGSAASIAAFLEAEGYKDTGWVPASDGPVPEDVGSPHGTVRVYLSPELVAFRQANPDPLVAPVAAGVMAVKEFYDASTVVGKAVIFYPGTDVVYHCYGPQGRCASTIDETTLDTAVWGDEEADAVGQCNLCHGGNVFTELPAD